MYPDHRSLLIVGIFVVPLVALADAEIPASLIRIPDSVATVFVAETSSARFHRIEHSGDKLLHNGSFHMSFGQKGVGKQRAGDRRTPLGVYFVTEQLDTARLHEKYGVTAFPLDYPNEWDLQAKRGGDGIWVHGVHAQGGERPARDTDGCIALANEDLTILAQNFEDNVTPVLVTQVIDWVDANQNRAVRVELEGRISKWIDSKATGDLHAYLSLYDDDFMRWGMNKTEWSSFLVQTVGERAVERATVSELLLLGYPDEPGLYLSRFRLTTINDERETVSTSRIYWRRDASDTLKIIAEDEG
jgi:murein L,D-transpeptidase YafK